MKKKLHHYWWFSKKTTLFEISSENRKAKRSGQNQIAGVLAPKAKLQLTKNVFRFKRIIDVRLGLLKDSCPAPW